MSELLSLIQRIKKCDDAINADAVHVLIKTTEELGELAAEVLKVESAHMRKDQVSPENVDEFLEDMLKKDMPAAAKLELLRDSVKRRTPDLDEVDRETADVVISALGVPLFCGSSPERVVAAVYEKLERFEKRIAAQQYHIKQLFE